MNVFERNGHFRTNFIREFPPPDSQPRNEIVLSIRGTLGSLELADWTRIWMAVNGDIRCVLPLGMELSQPWKSAQKFLLHSIQNVRPLFPDGARG